MGTDEIISVFSFDVQIFSSTPNLLSSDVTLISVSFYSFINLFLLLIKWLLKIFGESLPSCWHGVIVYFKNDFSFIFIDEFLENNGVVRVDIEPHERVTYVFKLLFYTY